MHTYYDENGTMHILNDETIGKKDITSDISNMISAKAMEKQVEELKRKNELYEQEIKELHRNGTITKWTAIISVVMSLISLLISSEIIVLC